MIPRSLDPHDPESRLDSCARLHWGASRRFSSYTGFGVVGAVAGVAFMAWLAWRVPISATALTVAVVAPMWSFALALYAQRVLWGSTRLVLYRMYAVVLAATALGLWAEGQDIARGLDFCVLGLGVFSASSRLGCLSVGCCHGRPARAGIRYSEDHRRAGFPAAYIGVRLFPVQLVSAAVHAGLVLASLAVAARAVAPGVAALVYLAGYGTLRAFVELARGDVRPHWRGVSEAQWISLTLVLGCAATAHSLVRVRAPWPYDAAAATVVGLVAALVWMQRRAPTHAWQWRAPERVLELADGLRRLAAQGGATGGPVPYVDTPRGLRISYSAEDGHHYCLSRAGVGLRPAEARVLASQIRALGGHPPGDTTAGRSPGLYHVRFPG